MNLRDYSQQSDPYEINKEYTSQSADVDIKYAPPRKSSAAIDIRGNSTCIARPVPTQDEADAIRRQA